MNLAHGFTCPACEYNGTERAHSIIGYGTDQDGYLQWLRLYCISCEHMWRIDVESYEAIDDITGWGV